MYNSDEILKMLNEGKTASEIAKEMETSLNTAIREKREMDQKKESEETGKLRAMEDVIDSISAYLMKYVPGSKEFVETMQGFGDKDLRELCDAMDGFVKMTNDFKKLEFKLPPWLR